MQFVYQPLTWAFFLVLIPLVIHLINMMRHKRVQWAAMDFLLKSYKKHRRWVWLKQLLLLLLRMLAIAAVVAMLAKLVTNDELSSLFGRQTTHHYVLLDDSLSMSDRMGGSEAFDRARQAIGQITANAGANDTEQKITLIRYSKSRDGEAVSTVEIAPPTSDESAGRPDVADLNAVRINSALEAQLEEKGRSFDVTELAVGPTSALGIAEQLIASSDDDKQILHLVSDFREADWTEPGEVRDQLSKISKSGAEIQFIRCANDASANLAITGLEPMEGTQAAGVPLFVNVKVTNYSDTPAEQVPIKVRSTFHGMSPDGKESSPESSDLPDLLIERINPGATVTRQFQVYFPTTGKHTVQASLPLDAIEADNRRWCVIDLPVGEPVLIVDGGVDQQALYYLESIFQPGTKARTGILPESQPPSYLRDVAIEELERFRTIYLLNVGQLDQRAARNLEEYVRNGGGLAIFMGPNFNASFYNNWYAEGSGLFPAPLTRPVDLPAANDPNVADVQFQDNPILEVLLGERNPFARSIRINRYIATPDLWSPPTESPIEILATLRNRKPLMLQRPFGDGRVVAVLTTLAPEWNNWALEPSFIIVALRMQSYLSERGQSQRERLTGAPLEIQLDSAKYRPEITVALPSDAGPGAEVELTAEPVGAGDSPVLSAQLGVDTKTGIRNEQTNKSGIYEASIRTLDGVPNRRRYSVNVNPLESNLSIVSTADLIEDLKPVKVTITDADQLLYQADTTPGRSWSEFILWVLIAILIIEQLLAYSASYHAKPLARAGGAT